MHELHGMTVTVDRVQVLDIVRANREKHHTIVEEARTGYIDKARAALEKRLQQLKAGKVASLHFSLAPPQDHTEAYDTIIEMLQLHTEAEVRLSASQVRHFVMDQWDWKTAFLTTNALYSKMAADEIGESDDEPRGK